MMGAGSPSDKSFKRLRTVRAVISLGRVTVTKETAYSERRSYGRVWKSSFIESRASLS